VADLQVSLAFLLENEAEVARALEAAGGKAGKDFGDRLSEQARKAFNDISAAAEGAAKKVGVIFNRETLQFQTVKGDLIPPQTLDQLAKADKGFAQARQAVDAFRSSVTTMSREAVPSVSLLEAAVSGLAFSLANSLTNAAGSALGSVKGLVNGFLELDGELRLASAAAGEQGGYERLAGIVNKVGVEAAGTTKQVAELSTSLIRAGFSVSEVEGALPGVVRGAEATGTSFEAFGNIVGNTLRGFGLEVAETSRVVDVLTNTANSSNASVEGLGYTFEYTAPIAKALGVSLEDVAAAAGLMANAGIQGSVAGTGLRTGLQKLQQAAGGASPEVLGLARGQERLQKAMAQLGATVSDASGKLLPMEEVFLRLKAAMEKLSQADQVQLASVLFGDEAGSKFLAIINQSSAAISKMFGDIRNSTGATDTARNAMQGMGMDLKRLEGTVDSLANQLGGLIAAGLKPMLDAANAVADLVSGLPAPVRNSAGALIALAGAATAASVGMAALNLAVAQLGGWAALKSAVTVAAATITGPFGAGVVIIAGMAAAAGALAGSFKGASSEARTLVQTAAGLGAMVGTMTLVATATTAGAGAMTLFGNATKAAAAAAAVLQGVTKGGVIGLVAGLAAGAATYVAIGKAMEGAADQSQKLSERQRELKDEISQVQERIAKQKELKIDTTISQAKLAKLTLELQAIEEPLEIQLDIKKAEAEIKALEERLNKLQSSDKKKSTAGVVAQLDAAKAYKEFLEQMDSGGSMDAFAGPIKQAGVELTFLRSRLTELAERKVALPFDAKADREQIDREIAVTQQSVEGRQLLIKLGFDEASTQEQLLRLRTAIAAGFVNGPKLQFLRDEEEVLFIRLLEIQKQARTVAEGMNSAASVRVDLAKQAVDSQITQLNAAQGQIELEQQALGLTQQGLERDRQRLQLVQSTADALLNLANSQAAYQQSGYDVERSRNSLALSSAEKWLQIMRDRGANAEEIAVQERYIAGIKKEQEGIEYRAMQANIDATTQRIAMERQILGIKQAGQLVEAQAAEAQARSDVLSQEMKLKELQIKYMDPDLKPEKKAQVQQLIDLQGQAIEQERKKLQFAQGRYAQLGLLFGLEQQSLQTQGQTTANQLRASAAAKGWEGSLSKALEKLDQMAFGYERVESESKKLTGSISTGRGQTELIYEYIRKLPAVTNDAGSAAEKLAGALNSARINASDLLLKLQGIARFQATGKIPGGDGITQGQALPAIPAARWAGGPVTPGAKYQVNEMGTESFLSAGGALSLITAPAYGTWSPPVRGTVLPAGVTARLQDAGALPGGSGRAMAGMRGAAGAPGSPGAPGAVVATDGLALTKLQGSIDRLQSTIAAYDPSLQVHLPGNAGLLATLQAFR
jgi:hypothetical protein